MRSVAFANLKFNPEIPQAGFEPPLKIKKTPATAFPKYVMVVTDDAFIIGHLELAKSDRIRLASWYGRSMLAVLLSREYGERAARG